MQGFALLGVADTTTSCLFLSSSCLLCGGLLLLVENKACRCTPDMTPAQENEQATEIILLQLCSPRLDMDITARDSLTRSLLVVASTRSEVNKLAAPWSTRRDPEPQYVTPRWPFQESSHDLCLTKNKKKTKHAIYAARPETCCSSITFAKASKLPLVNV